MKIRDLTVSELLKYRYNDNLEFDIVIRDQYGHLIPLDMEVAKCINAKFTIKCGNCSTCPISDYCNHEKSNSTIYEKLVDTFDRLERITDVSIVKKDCIIALIRQEKLKNKSNFTFER